MYIITVYGWEDRAATRVMIGCEGPALTVKAYVESIGYTTGMKIGDDINRSDAEELRAKRLMDLVGHVGLLNVN